MEQQLITFLTDMAQNQPWFLTFLLIMSVARAIFKPGCALVAAYVSATPTKADDEKWGEFLKSKAYWAIDYLLSIKLPG